MNEITHEQARRLMQSEVDGLLDEGGFARQEWANLHSHLETCSDCRLEERRLRTLQRELHGALRAGLDAHEPPPVSLQPLIDARATREKHKTRLTRAAVLLPLALLLILLSIWLRPDQLLVALLDPWGTASKEFYGSFSGQIVFESRRNNNLDLFLLQGGAFPQNLTDHPADDSDAVWSPDGAWVAFLSDRAEDPLNARAVEEHEELVGRNMLFNTPIPEDGQIVSPGKREVYALAPGADQPPTQLSAEYGVAWMAPLTWSADGKTLALAGRLLPAAVDNMAEFGTDSWVYSLRLDGSGAGKQPNTRGSGQARFAPVGRWLGYHIDLRNADQVVFRQLDEDNPDSQALIPPEPTNEGQYRPGPGFAWSPGGSELAYIVEGPFLNRGGRYQPSGRAVSQLRRVTGFPGRLPVDLLSRPLVELPLVDGLRDVAWSPDGTSLAMLQGAEQDPCWSLLVGRIPQVVGTEMEIYPIEGLCAEGPFTSRPWTPDGRWLLFGGRWHGGNPAIYALDVRQAIQHPNWAPLVARLTDPNGLDRLPQVQPEFPNLGIVPQPVAAEALRQPLSAADVASAPGHLALDVYAGVTDMDLQSLAPGDAQPVVISAQPGWEGLPAWSPDGGQIALIGINFTSSATSHHLYVSSVPAETATRGPQAAGGPQVASGPPELTDLTPNGMHNISTPSWSPDGQNLTAVIVVGGSTGATRADIKTALAVFAADGDPLQTFYVPSGGAQFLEVAAWSPRAGGSQQIAALVSGRPYDRLTRYELALAVVDLSQVPVERVVIVYQSVEGIAPGSVRGLAWEPDGRRVAVLAEVEEGGMTYPKVVVFRADAGRDPLISRDAWFAEMAVAAAPLPEQSFVVPQPRATQVVRDDGLRWRPGADELSLVVNEINRARIVLYPATGSKASVLLEWDEAIYQHAWSPDGAWLAFSAESGVWLVNIAAHQQGAAPYRLFSQGGWDGLTWGP